MQAERMRVDAQDGRGLDVLFSGRSTSIPLVMNHGTPSSNVQYEPFARAADERDLRLVTYSRPGYGGSDRHEGRRVRDCAADVAAILDALGADRSFVMGASGGGPHALACAALLPDRVIACATIASVAPYAGEELDFFAGMGEENIVEFGLALNDHAGLIEFMEKERASMTGVSPAQVIEQLRTLLSPPDVEALSGELGEHFVKVTDEGLRSGIWGWYDDDIAFVEPWGLDLSAISVPVTLWQGGQDLMVPQAHGRWLAKHVVGSQAEFRPEHGHLSLAVSSVGEVLDRLIATAS